MLQQVPTRAFHAMAKPSGSACNLNCTYCFYLEKHALYPLQPATHMDDATLEAYVRHYIAACEPQDEIAFTWQGGEPTLLGLDFYRRAVALQHTYGAGRRISNSFQTNGVLLDDEWCAFLAQHHFLVGRSLAIEHNGDVYACDHYVYPEYRRGNLHHETFASMVDSPVQVDFGKEKYSTLPTQCRECAVLKACWGGCPKHRFMQTASGEPGLNYLCTGFQRYFGYLPPYLKAMADLLANGRPVSDIMKVHLVRAKQ